jgi:glycosyltransferase involved in cell wall biosynthesis
MVQRGERIAIFVPSLGGGGAERVMVTLANAFAESGYSVDLVLAKAEGEYLNQLRPELRVIDLKSARVMSSIPALVRYLRESRPAVVLSALTHANLAAILARLFSRVKFRLVVSERANLSVSAANANSLRMRLIKRLVAMAYPYADHVITVSQGVADDLVHELGISASKVTAVYNPVVDDALLALSHEPVSDPWFEDLSVPVVVGAGRLVRQKDFATLMHAVGLVNRHQPVRLVILGEGDLRDELSALIESEGYTGFVRLAGFQENPFAYMRKASLFVLSSAWEGLPGTLIQAMACGVPVVSTDCPDGPAEILEGGRWGRLVPVGDVKAMAAAIEKTLNADECPKVYERALHFSVDNAVQRYLEILLPLNYKPQNQIESRSGEGK